MKLDYERISYAVARDALCYHRLGIVCFELIGRCKKLERVVEAAKKVCEQTICCTVNSGIVQLVKAVEDCER